MNEPPTKFTHQDLVELAHRWLLGAGRCEFAFAEVGVPNCPEMPDAIGYMGNAFTVLVECKTSRADFFADAKKPFRKMPSLGLGGFRYFLVPAGLVKPDELPAKWGLIYAYPSGQTRGVVHPLLMAHDKRKAFLFGQDERNTGAELRLLLAALRRVHLKGFWHVVEAAFYDVPGTEALPLREPVWDTTEAV